MTADFEIFDIHSTNTLCLKNLRLSRNSRTWQRLCAPASTQAQDAAHTLHATSVLVVPWTGRGHSGSVVELGTRAATF
jgi:hypothetical protein